ncbi:MAG: XrtA/PEP-CTERM system histidine kinase PrsK [Tsuneonella sp.]
MSLPADQFWAILGFVMYLAGAAASTVVAVWLHRRENPSRADRGPTIAALVISTLWCVGDAAMGPHVLLVATLETARNLAWVLVLYRLFAIDGRDHSMGQIRPLVLVLGFVECLQPALAVVGLRFAGVAPVHDLVFGVSAIFRVLVAVGALVLLHNLYAGASSASRQVLRWSAAALAGMWAYHLNFYTTAWFTGELPTELAALRGLVAAIMACLLAVAANARAADLKLLPSRAVAFQTFSLIVIGGYLLAMMLIARSLSLLGGDLARLTQVGFVFVAVTAAVLWLPSRRMRGWLRVTAIKHLFQHRYDYRAEWLRFPDTLGRAGSKAMPLPERAIQALADITDSPGGLLLLPREDATMELGARWQWPGLEVPGVAAGYELSALLERANLVVDLDDVRAGRDAMGEAAMIPEWLVQDPRAWALVPLVHYERLTGVVVLARPALARRLDWEDFDLLKVVGRQLASYLAEQAGQQALMEAARFDEFNRRMAFVMHDIKNLASQLTLLARNAEKHVDNPEFRKDMLVTLTNSADKLNALLKRLGRYGASGSAARQPVDLTEIGHRVAERYRGAHRVEMTRSDPCTVLADPDALEQALAHLVQNAVDASPPEMPVCIDVSGDGLRGRLEVVDSGAGMSPQFVRDGLFKPFVSSKDGGFGIGAFEARELVRAMGGRLEVESREGLGTRFTVVLPLSAAAGFLSGGMNKQDEVA